MSEKEFMTPRLRAFLEAEIKEGDAFMNEVAAGTYKPPVIRPIKAGFVGQRATLPSLMRDDGDGPK